ncbi:hypothetical protein ACN3XK_16960 [Actinomadura welshii]
MTGETITPRDPVTVDVGAAQTRQIVVGATVAGALGVLALASVVTGNVEGGTGARVAAFVIGLVFALIGVLPLLMWRIAFRPRRLVLDADGVRWEDPEGSPWAVRWPELGRVTLSYPAPDYDSPRVSSAVNLDLRPAEPGFRDAHPEMGHLIVRGVDGYRVPFGHAHSVIGPLDGALRSFAPAIYRREGPEIPVPRDRPRAVKAGVGLLACYWGASMTIGFVAGGYRLWNLAVMLFWTSLVAWWLVRVWAGGRTAVRLMAGLAKALGVVFLVMMAGFLLILATALDAVDVLGFGILWAFLPGLASGTALLVSGRLLSRDDVRAWSASRGWGL